MTHHGKAGTVTVTIDAGTPVKIATVSAWTLDMKRDTVETTSMGAKNKTYVTGLPDIKGTIELYWDDADDTFFDGIDSPTGVTLELQPDADLSPLASFKGPAWLSGSIKSGVTAAVTLSGDFVANGPWTRTSASRAAATAPTTTTPTVPPVTAPVTRAA